MSTHLIAAEIEPAPNQSRQAAMALQRTGFKIHQFGATISVEGPRSLWEATFQISFEERKKKGIDGLDDTERVYQRPLSDQIKVPTELQSLVVGVMIQEPPEFY